MCSAYPAIWRGIHSSHSARVIGRIVSSASVTPSSNQARVALMKDGTASHTARRVAAHRLEYERVAADYGDPAADQALTADVADGQQPNPGRMHEHLRARTAFFDRAVVNALGRGVRQVVIGGAGYDGRALRYAKPGVTWFELDHPATQADKVARVARLGLERGQVRFIAADFTADPIAEPLLAAGLDPARPTLFLLEGVVVYLERPVVERVLAAFRQVAADGSELAMSGSTGTAAPQERARLQQRVAALGEPMRSQFTPDQARDLLAAAGWQPSAAPERQLAAGLLLARAGALQPAGAHDRWPPPTGPARLRPRRPGIDLRVPGRRRLARPPAVGPAVGGAGRVHHRGRQRGRAPTAAPHHQRRPVARRDRRRALAHLAADVGQLPAPPPRRGRHGGRTAPPGADRHQPGRHAPLGLRQLHPDPGRGKRPGPDAIVTPPRPPGPEVWQAATEETEARWRTASARPRSTPGPPWPTSWPA